MCKENFHSMQMKSLNCTNGQHDPTKKWLFAWRYFFISCDLIIQRSNLCDSFGSWQRKFFPIWKWKESKKKKIVIIFECKQMSFVFKRCRQYRRHALKKNKFILQNITNCMEFFFKSFVILFVIYSNFTFESSESILFFFFNI